MHSLYDRHNVNDMWAVSILKTLYFKNIVHVFQDKEVCVCVCSWERERDPIYIYYTQVYHFDHAHMEWFAYKGDATDIPIKRFWFFISLI